MNKLNLMLTANPSEFAAIFGEIRSDAVTAALARTSGLPQGAAPAAGMGPAGHNGPRGNRKPPGVPNPSLEASIQALGSRRHV
jgi:hypothetical protein